MKVSRRFKWMLSGSLFVLLSIVVFNQLLAQSPYEHTWQRVSPMPTGVFFACGSQQGNQYIVTGGVTATGNSSDVIQVLDLDQLTWRSAGYLPVSRFAHAQATLADGRILIAGGRSGNVTENHKMQWLVDAMIWDPATGVITPLPDLSRQSAGPSANTLPNGRTVVVTGLTAHRLSPDGSQWDKLAHLRTARANHGAVAVSDHHLLLVGGTGRKSMELLDVNTMTSQMLPCRLPQPTDDMAVAQMGNGQIWITGGQDTLTGHTLSQTWLLHLNVNHPDDAAMVAGPLINDPGGCADHQLVQRASWLMGMGGEAESDHHDTELKLAWMLDTVDSSLLLMPDLLEPHDDALAVVYHDQLLVMGGYQKKAAFFGVLVIPTATRTVERLKLE